MTYKEIKFHLNNIKEENRLLELYSNEYDRMSKLLEIEKQKTKPNNKRIEAITQHLHNIRDFKFNTIKARTSIIFAIGMIDEPYSSIILERYFERKSFQEIEIKYHYTETTIKKYIERGVNKLEEKINEIEGNK